ncbi:hypothetical protein, partial [Sphingomonas sp. DC3200b1]|uniref:hypothetical protein n=1 Tax=Sphingomonas sp. DC3200b1 TaxID=2804668 RepID=UPI003CEA88BC
PYSRRLAGVNHAFLVVASTRFSTVSSGCGTRKPRHRGMIEWQKLNLRKWDCQRLHLVARKEGKSGRSRPNPVIHINRQERLLWTKAAKR